MVNRWDRKSGSLLAEGEALSIDFANVEAMSHSFADECFGDLFCEFGAQLFRDRLHLTNLNSVSKSLLRLVLVDRRGRSVDSSTH